MKNAFSLLLFCSFYFLSPDLHAQADEGRWEYFYFFNDPVAIAQTTNHVWVAFPEGILQVDKVNDQIKMVHPLFEVNYNDSYKGLWVSEQNEIHFISQDNRIGHFDGDNWQIDLVPFATNLFTVAEILHKYDNGDYLFRGEYAVSFFLWNNSMPFPRKLNQNTTGGFSWLSQDAVLGPQQKIWAWQGNQLAFMSLEEATATTYDLPPEIGPIEDLKFDPNGQIWLETDDGLWLEAESGWKHFAFADGPLQNLQFKNNEQALLTFTDRTIVLSQEQNQLTATDVSEDFSTAPISAYALYSAEEQLWFVEKTKNNIWTKINDTQPQKVPNFSILPLSSNNVFERIQKDAEGRIWLSNLSATFFYTNHSWVNAQELFPNFPDSVFQLLFTPKGEPVVLHFIEGLLTLSARQEGIWHPLPTPDNLSPLTLSSLSFGPEIISLDRDGNLWWQALFPSSLHLWQRNQWVSLLPNDFSPNPFRFNSIAFNKKNHLAFTSNTGFYIYDGFFTEFFVPSDFGLENSFFHIQASEKEGNYWANNSSEIFHWQDDQALAVPITEQSGALLEISLSGCFPFADDNVWCLGWQENEQASVAQYNGSFWQVHSSNTETLRTRSIRDILQDANGSIWIKGWNSISVYHPPNDRLSPPSSNGNLSAINIYPSPACCYAQVDWQNATATQVSLQLYNAQGQLIRTLAEEWQEAGEQRLSIARDGLPAGLYYVRLQSGDQVSSAAVVFE